MKCHQLTCYRYNGRRECPARKPGIPRG
jgi:hypothetical protein